MAEGIFEIRDDVEIETTEELEARSKPLQELVFDETFTVEGVVSQSYLNSVMTGPMMIGSPNPKSKTGYKTKLSIKVIPDNKIPVTELVFYGDSIIKAGDKVIARIPKYDILSHTKVWSFQS